MDIRFLYILGAVVLDGAVGLTGGFLPPAWVKRHMTSLLAFAAGTLVATTFLHLLPEALTLNSNPTEVMTAALIGFVTFYVVETFIGSHAAGQSGHKHSTIGPMILVGDALHNATDGIALAAAFMTDVKTGLATTLAVLVHELPQEVGDYTILISHGYTRRKAMFWLALVQFSALLGALGALWISAFTTTAAPFLLAASAGGFLYIAAADLLPELHRQSDHSNSFTKFMAFGTGVTIVILLEIFAA